MTPALLRTYADIYAVTDAVVANDGDGYPAGATTRMWRAVDGLRANAAPAAHVGQAAGIALTLEQLHLALRRPTRERAAAARLVKRHIAALGREWLEALPMAFSRNPHALEGGLSNA